MEWLLLCLIGFLLWLHVKITQLPFDLQDTDNWWSPKRLTKHHQPKEKKVKEDFFMRE